MSCCQHCLADSRYTGLGPVKERRCPVCGADYSGPRRDAEHAAIRDAGLLPRDPKDYNDD